MKKIVTLAMLFVGLAAFNTSKAQISVSLNIGAQPAWGPTGYDYVDNYYLPDIECYYNVPRHQFIYLDGGQWVCNNALPPRFRGYDLYSGYKVVVNGREPYRHFNDDRMRYAQYRGGNFGQRWIRDSHDDRNMAVRDNRNNWNSGNRGDFNRGGNDWNRNNGGNRGNWGRNDNHNDHDNRNNGGNRGGNDPHGDRGNWGRH